MKVNDFYLRLRFDSDGLFVKVYEFLNKYFKNKKPTVSGGLFYLTLSCQKCDIFKRAHMPHFVKTHLN